MMKTTYDMNKLICECLPKNCSKYLKIQIKSLNFYDEKQRMIWIKIICDSHPKCENNFNENNMGFKIPYDTRPNLWICMIKQNLFTPFNNIRESEIGSKMIYPVIKLLTFFRESESK